VLDEAQQSRLRRHQATTCLLLRQIVQRVMQDDSVLIHKLVDALALLDGPVRSFSVRHRYTL
jgi:DNA-binding MltR family transcriptional regulator